MKTVQRITDADIQRAAQLDTLDAAVFELQTIANIETGDRAGLWFTERDIDVWPIASCDARADMLRAYLAHEAAHDD